jgi:hypothetical protein
MEYNYVGDQKGPNKVDCPCIGYLKTGGEQLFEKCALRTHYFDLKRDEVAGNWGKLHAEVL